MLRCATTPSSARTTGRSVAGRGIIAGPVAAAQISVLSLRLRTGGGSHALLLLDVPYPDRQEPELRAVLALVDQHRAVLSEYEVALATQRHGYRHAEPRAGFVV